MNDEMLFHLRSLTRVIYFVTEEEDRFLTQLNKTLEKFQRRTFVFNPAQGLMTLEQQLQDWKNKQNTQYEVRTLAEALTRIYTDDPRDEQNFYIILDPEQPLSDPSSQRRILNIIHQLRSNDRNIKILIFVSSRLVIPQKLRRYIEVIHDTGLTTEEIEGLVTQVHSKLPESASSSPPTAAITQHLRGLTSFEIDAVLSQSIIKTKRDLTHPRRIDPKYIAEFKRRQIRRSGLLDFVDVDQYTFDQVGGNDRFKSWARRTAACWTPEGQAFGLTPPKGVLAVGVWGCGKSLCVKALANAWKLPVIPLETGQLRSSAVGETEHNARAATRLIEAVAPCIVWVDEAEKTLAGGQSSGQSDAGTTSRLIGILSTWLQETTAPVCLAMTANSLRTMPVEFVNRMNERFFFDLPSEDERIDILKIHLAKRGQDPASFQLAELSEVAVNMVGREIEQAIDAALISSFSDKRKTLGNDILLEELAHKPRIFKTMSDELNEILEWVGYDPDIQDGVRARFASSKRSEHFKSSRG